MTLRNQIRTLKENWLLILIVVVVLGFFMLGGSPSYDTGGIASPKFASMEMDEAMVASSGSFRGIPYPGGDFAPEVEERKITKTASLSTEVERGGFQEAESTLKSIVESSESFLLNENSRKIGADQRSYFTGSYQIKVETTKYDFVISQLKQIGEVQSFNENAQDVTGRYVSIEDDIETEKARLERYEKMYEEATEIEDKINLNDRIFNQERRIKYLEDSLENLDKRVDYSTVHVSITEKRSDYIDVQLVKLSELIETIVDSFNSLLYFVFAVLPWAIAALIIWLVVRFFKKR